MWSPLGRACRNISFKIRAPASGALSGELAETLLNPRTASHAVQSVSPVHIGTVDRSGEVITLFLSTANRLSLLDSCIGDKLPAVVSPSTTNDMCVARSQR